MIYRFADCELDTARFELRRAGKSQKIEPQVFEILRYLVEHHDQFVSKEELHAAIWQGRVVSDAAMSSRIKAVRRAIGDNGSEQRMIRTVHGRGLSFVAPVTASPDGERPEGKAEVAAEGTLPGEEVALSADLHLNEILSGNGVAVEADAMLSTARAALRREVEKTGCEFVSSQGDEIAARLPGEVEALECAASLQHPHWRTGDDVSRVRIGLCEFRGDPVAAYTMAGRLQCFAAPGEICATGRIADRAQGKHLFETRPIEAGPAQELGELRPLVIEPTQIKGGSEQRIPQLQCGPPAPSRDPSMVILPFDPVGSAAATAELAEGLRIDIQNAFVQISRFLLIAAATANAFRGKSPEEAARSLGVRYVLHGVVRLSGQRARVNMELIDARSARALWTERFDAAMTDTFTIQDEIARKVVAALDVKLYSGEQARIWHQALSDPNAVKTFYRGVRLFFRMDREAMAEARKAFEGVAAMRPKSSIGSTWVALSHWIDYMRRWSGDPGESKRLAKQWAARAAPLPDVDGQAHTVLAHVHLLDREFDAALEAGKHAVTVRAGCANANGFFGNVLHYCGDQTLAISHLRCGIRRQPIYPPFFASVLAAAYLASGQPHSAAVAAKEALRLNPRDLQARLVLITAYQKVGRAGMAQAFAREIPRLEPGFSVEAYYDNQPYRNRETVRPIESAWRAAQSPG